MNIKELINESYSVALEKGWHSPSKSDIEAIALCITELAEAIEEIRVDADSIYQTQDVLIEGHWTEKDILPNDSRWNKNLKPEGIVVELADCIIRIADLCGKNNWDLETALRIKMDYNKTRSFRHGNKKY